MPLLHVGDGACYYVEVGSKFPSSSRGMQEISESGRMSIRPLLLCKIVVPVYFRESKALPLAYDEYVRD